MENEFRKEFEKQETDLENLLGTSLDKQRILIEGDYESLSEITRTEEKLLSRIQQNRKNIIDKIRGLHLQSSSDELRYDDILYILESSLHPDDFAPLRKLIQSMKEISRKVLRTNQQNLHLLNFSKHFIDDTMNTILSSSRKTVLDRKV